MIDQFDSRLSLLELKCRQPVEHILAGEFRSVFKGHGTEFEDVRPYQPGDDVRSIDWRVTARSGETYIKRYIEEREQILYLLVDVSASVLDISAGKKHDMVAELAGLLTMAAAKNQDRVSLLLFTDEIELLMAPSKGRTHTLRILDALLNYQPNGRQTKFQPVLSQFGHFARKRSAVFVISDFLANDYSDELSALSAKHDVNTIKILEKHSLNKSNELIHFQDSETDQQRYVDLKSVQQPNNQKESFDPRIGQLEITIGDNCAEKLTGYFRTKKS